MSRPQSGPEQEVPQSFLEVFPVSAALCLLWAVSRRVSEFHKRCAWEQSCCIPQCHRAAIRQRRSVIHPRTSHAPTHKMGSSNFRSGSADSVPFSTLATTPVTPRLFIPTRCIVARSAVLQRQLTAPLPSLICFCWLQVLLIG